MRYSLLTSSLLLLLIATACQKNDTEPAPGSRLDSITTRDASNNSVVSGEKYKYDNTGKLVQYKKGNTQTIEFRYDAQNKLTTILKHGITSPLAVDTFVYSANGRIVNSYQYASGTNSLMQSRIFILDNSNRVVLDSIYIPTTATGVFSVYYFKYYYDAKDDVQSTVYYRLYSYNPSIPTMPLGYMRQDSIVCAHDGNENPFYKNMFAIYASLGPSVPFSKHNLIAVKHFQGNVTQPNISSSYVTSYYKNGLMRTQYTDNSAAGIPTNVREFLYR